MTKYNAKLLILVMRDAECFYHNVKTDKKFSEKFFEALQKGVEVEIRTFSLIESQIVYKRNIQICDKISLGSILMQLILNLLAKLY
ncbi:Sugar fermentation stimulation protein A [Sulfuracidifex tepidarius]|uniref:Sugar fermentation stimulation protein A n=1 Tax=Sulfuracidifex tepidarius TaxID=1294262 RepID=A0A510E1W9_9CREN|nr:Sugar fermentation stimulation protein A [Sulfuracidifex tepidarius]